MIPKAGSSTVRSVIDPYRDIKRPTDHFSEHVTIDRFLQSKHADLASRYFKFSFVRNPYDRLYSGFMQDFFAAYNLPHWEEAKRPIFDTIGEDFNRYVQDYAAKADVINDAYWICFCPMHKFTHRAGDCMMDWIGRNESLEADLRILAGRLDIEPGEIQRRNVRSKSDTPGRHLVNYRKKTIEIVNELYKDDFEAFGYELAKPSDFAS
ncbi:hypothetical protein ASE63_20005 [Bosea sp. Root381]|nr:hypothetical protein ASE63_20005 [Bosea sp. Root381]